MQELLDLDDALELLLKRNPGIDGASERVTLAAARHRVTDRDVSAPENLPPFPASAMDGYAVCATDPVFSGSTPYRLTIAGTSLAGEPFTGTLQPAQTIRTFTGAVMPDGSDAVIVQEDVQRRGNLITTSQRPASDQHVREVGNDIRRDATLVSKGEPLGPFQLAWMAACGIEDVLVRPMLKVSLFSTGDELVEPGAPLGPGQIYESNRRVLRELMGELPVEVIDLGVLPDQPDQIRRTLAHAAETSHVVLTSGGVSVGEADFVKDVVLEIGQLEFWKLALKPGKPLAYGQIGNAAFFGLPGNPVSTIVTFLLLVKPVLRQLTGAKPAPALRLAARLGSNLQHSIGRAEYQRGTLSEEPEGLVVHSTGDQGSNRIGSFRSANCLIEIPKSEANLSAGAQINVLPFHGLLG